ncbi:spore germination protein [Gottfriedia acidiceleris]|uniref:spore germination protein n=1 Tax=Gottfriedia acidiceleris TaxID=371036 RepID=UPI00101C4EDE|nr:spore germination protein [Gottfriedia acidiceleris]
MSIKELTNLTSTLKKNINIIQGKLNNTSDLIVRKMIVGESSSINAVLLYIDGIVNMQHIQDYIVIPLLTMKTNKFLHQLIEEIAYHHIKSGDVTISDSIAHLTEELLKGKTVILFDNCAKGILADTAEWEKRGLNETISERVFLGPIIGFTEKLKTNVNLIRSNIKTTDLCIESKQIGTLTKTDISILYVKGIAEERIIDDVRTKINQINIKYLIESRMIEESLEGNVKTIFPLVLTTERPDSTVSALLEGRVAILVDGTPHAILVPALFIQFLQTPDEYYHKFARFIGRFTRILCFLVTIYTPGLYLSIFKIHNGVITEETLQKVLGKEQAVIPIFWQVIFLLFILEFIMDGSFRLPKSAVFVVSLIGTIFVAETTISSNLIYGLSIIIMGLTYITSFLLISRGLLSAIFASRIIFLLLGQLFGFIGIIVGTTIMVLYLASLRSIGVPYLAPLLPFNPKEIKDVLFRGNTRKLINSEHSYPYDRVDKGESRK